MTLVLQYQSMPKQYGVPAQSDRDRLVIDLAMRVAPGNLDWKPRIIGKVPETEMQIGAPLARVTRTAIDLRDQPPSIRHSNGNAGSNG
jgi:hypothetical protein